jgi:D-alanine-D-alanine ligase
MASGIRIVQALRERGHEVTSLDPAKGVISAGEEHELSTGKVGTEPPSLESLSKFAEGAFLPNLTSMKEIREADVAFLALHGGQGEDGTIQALLDMARVKYTGSGLLSSALALDKDLSKKLFRMEEVKTVG